MSQHQGPHRQLSQHYHEDAGEFKWIQARDDWMEDTIFHIYLYKFDGI